ncbi:MAG: hypothetical protein KGI60_04780 [Patescibacteria group bacterium]|nr:hypothetical protein [Patescibacteria group bacterium]
MNPPKTPLIVLPPVYELPFRMWRWCRLSEVCAAVPANARLAGMRFKPTPEELVSNFAELVRLNLVPDGIKDTKHEPEPVKVFRYSVDGEGMSGTYVPLDILKNSRIVHTHPRPSPFQLDIPTPYPRRLFVRSDWALDTLAAIRRGATQIRHVSSLGLWGKPKGKRASFSIILNDLWDHGA